MTKSKNRAVASPKSRADNKARSRAAVAPPVPHASTFWRSQLFEAQDIIKIAHATAAKDGTLQLKPNQDCETVASRLHAAFHLAISTDIIAERQNFSPGRKREWFRRVERHARALMATLGLTPEQCADPSAPLPEGFELAAIWQLQEIVYSDQAPFCLPPEVDERLGSIPEVGRHVRDVKELRTAREMSWDYGTAENARGRAVAALMIDLVPRTLGLIVRLAQAGADETPKGKAGDHPDSLGRELFAELAGAHFLMFGRGPKTRDSTADRCGPSVAWARAILRHAAQRFPNATDGGVVLSDLPSRADKLARLADLQDATIADLLDAGWKAWTRDRRSWQ
jgi:hypothetical protein